VEFEFENGVEKVKITESDINQMNNSFLAEDTFFNQGGVVPGGIG